ncbi:hypothetical protein AB6A40_004081 [Gnathostoma spinigerum]|uniref:E2F/DP family winged-helix DNA-binding domain-containing protein n=1 Tax=Gnathostoma spinigerum TaxID=75299 RepID=A0ABD6EKZ0_9BILA
MDKKQSAVGVRYSSASSTNIDDDEVDVCTVDCGENSENTCDSTLITESCSSSRSSNNALDLSSSMHAASSNSNESTEFVLPPTTQRSKPSAKRSRINLDSQSDDVESEDGGPSSRKEKSLGLLCRRFLIAMDEEAKHSAEIHLETVARRMAIEKRRIYDIVNVMEALEAMSKTNKSFYRWHGLSDLPQLMSRLQDQAIAEGLPERVQQVEHAMCSFTELSPSSRRCGGDIVGTLVSTKTDPHEHENHSMAQRSAQTSDSNVDSFSSNNDDATLQQIPRDRNGKNSLAQLCRRFLMVLLSNPKDKRRVSLDVASTVLIKDPESEDFEPPSRSRCRRLYDIANVLVAMSIIKKVHYLFGTKKIPLFVYCGPEPDVNGKFDISVCIGRILNQPDENSPKASPDNDENQPPAGKRPCILGVSPLSSSKNVSHRKHKSDLDILVDASEKERLRLIASQNNVFGDENRAPVKLSRSTPKMSPVMLKTSNITLAKPKAEFGCHPQLVLNSQMIGSPSNVFFENRRPLNAINNNNTYQIYDPFQPHAFRRVENKGPVGKPVLPSSLASAVQIPPLPIEMPTKSSPKLLSSPYSVNAILGKSNKCTPIS